MERCSANSLLTKETHQINPKERFELPSLICDEGECDTETRNPFNHKSLVYGLCRWYMKRNSFVSECETILTSEEVLVTVR